MRTECRMSNVRVFSDLKRLVSVEGGAAAIKPALEWIQERMEERTGRGQT